MFQSYLDKLPPEARTDKGSFLITALNNLGGAALWAENYEEATKLYELGLQINPEQVILRSNLGLLKLIEGDTEEAAQEYDKAIASAQAYLIGEDGKPLEGRAKKVRLRRAGRTCRWRLGRLTWCSSQAKAGASRAKRASELRQVIAGQDFSSFMDTNWVGHIPGAGAPLHMLTEQGIVGCSLPIPSGCSTRLACPNGLLSACTW